MSFQCPYRPFDVIFYLLSFIYNNTFGAILRKCQQKQQLNVKNVKCKRKLTVCYCEIPCK